MATAYIEGPLTGHWGTDWATLSRWDAWGGGYRFAVRMNPADLTADLSIRGDITPPPDPTGLGPAPAAVPHELIRRP